MSLQNRVALVTGSTSGVGLGIAKSLAEQGASLILNGFGEPEHIQKILSQFEAEYRVRTFYSEADLAKPDAIAKMVQDAFEIFGRIDILVNNAGIQHVEKIDEFPTERWDAILAVNLSAVFHSIKLCLPRMRQQQWGRIINISSTHGLVASANKSAYVAAKHGVIGLTKAVALETALSKITCNAICPGWVLTPLVEKQIEALANSENINSKEASLRLLSEKQPSQEFVTAEQIGAAVLYLCSEAAAQVRGTALNIDGGWLAQ